MSGAIARSLRRIVDALQRSLFEDAVPAGDRAGEAGAAQPALPPAPPLGGSPRAPRRSTADATVRHLDLDGRKVAYRLRRSRRRSIGFQVGEAGLVVSAPKWLALRDVDEAVRAKRRWIVARLLAQDERASQAAATRTVWRDGAEVSFLGAPLRLVLDPSLPACSASLPALVDGDTAADAEAGNGQPAPKARELRLGLPLDAGAERIRDAVHGWLQAQAKLVFAERSAVFAARLGVVVKRISLSSATTRWGSASSTGNIRLHWRLVQFPLPTIDYVVAHELAHLREMNHGERFWNTVRSVLPDYEAARTALRQARLPSLD